MVEKTSEISGGEDLKATMPYGSIIAIAETFGKTPVWVGKLISAKATGNPLIVECASKISKLHLEYLENQSEILKGYE